MATNPSAFVQTLASLGGQSKQAATAVAGYTLVNGTGNVITWTTPNDGLQHRVTIMASLDVTVAETGGQISATYTTPDAGAGNHTLFAAGLGTTPALPAAPWTIIVGANTTVTVLQATALTVGAAVLWAEIWGS
jgi:hypothetical protein